MISASLLTYLHLVDMKMKKCCQLSEGDSANNYRILWQFKTFDLSRATHRRFGNFYNSWYVLDPASNFEVEGQLLMLKIKFLMLTHNHVQQIGTFYEMANLTYTVKRDVQRQTFDLAESKFDIRRQIIDWHLQNLLSTRRGAAYRPHGFLQYNIDSRCKLFPFFPEFCWKF